MGGKGAGEGSRADHTRPDGRKGGGIEGGVAGYRGEKERGVARGLLVDPNRRKESAAKDGILGEFGARDKGGWSGYDESLSCCMVVVSECKN